MNEVKLGQTAKDNVTGLKGKVTGIVQYIGLKRVELEYVNSQGDLKNQWFTIDRIEIVE